jgi:hypothetical protein
MAPELCVPRPTADLAKCSSLSGSVMDEPIWAVAHEGWDAARLDLSRPAPPALLHVTSPISGIARPSSLADGRITP